MKLRLSLLLGALVASYAVQATEADFCAKHLANFAAGPVDAEAEGLVTSTYRRLLKELGGSHFSPETIAKIIESGDPFLIPDEADGDFFALQKRLKEFHELVRARGWDSPSIHSALLLELGKLRVAQAAATETIQNATTNSFVDYALGFPDGASTTTSPDGRWVVGIEGKFSLVTDYYVHDRQSRHTKRVKMPQLPLGPPTFSTDGTELLFPNHTAQMNRVPFNVSTGEADFAQRMEIGKALGVFHSLATIFHAKTPGQFFAGRRIDLFDGTNVGDGDPKIQRFDLNTNERITVNLRESFRRVSISGWGVVPGTDDLWVLVHVPVAAVVGSTMPAWRVHVLSVAADGSVKQSQMPRTWTGGPIRGLYWQADGKTCVVHDNQGISIWGENNKPVMVFPHLIVPGDDGFVQASAPDPSQNRVAFLFRSRSGPARIDWLNMDTRQVERGFELNEPPEFRAIKFLPDGKGMLMLDSAGKWQVVNHLARP